MRRRTPLYIALLLLGLIAFAGYAVWAGMAGARIGFGWQGLGSAWPFLLAGVLTVGAAIALFVRLAVFSARRGYDDRANPRER